MEAKKKKIRLNMQVEFLSLSGSPTGEDGFQAAADMVEGPDVQGWLEGGHGDGGQEMEEAARTGTQPPSQVLLEARCRSVEEGSLGTWLQVGGHSCWSSLLALGVRLRI